MADIVVNDIDPRIQYTAAGGQTVFTYPFPIFANADLKVYQTPVGTIANDSTQLLTLTVNYTVTNNVAPAVGGNITLNVGATAGDIITIIRDMPQNRLINYLDGGQWSATQFNTDFDRTVMMSQTDKMYERDVAPHYNTSDIVNANASALSAGVDLFLPILPPNCAWVKNAANTAIVAQVPFSGTGGVITLPSVPNKIAYFTNATGTLASSIFSTPTADGNLGDSITTDGAGNQRVATTSGINRLINGDFQVWQRGAGGAATFAVVNTTLYTADRWQCQVLGAGTAVHVTQVAGATSGSWLARVQRDAANANVAPIQFAQSLTRDMCLGAAGRIVTISFKARAGANFSSAANGLNVNLNYGTGNNDISNTSSVFTGNTGLINQIQILTGVLTNYSFTSVALPATVTQLSIDFSWTPVGVAGANDYFDITDIQLEISNNQSPFQRKTFLQELFECQGFYQKSFLYATLPVQNATRNTGETQFPVVISANVAQSSPSILFQRPMRVAPSAGNNVITLFNPQAANAQISDEGPTGVANVGDTTGATAVNISTNGYRLTYTGNAGGTAGDVMGIHWTAEGEVF